MGEALYFGIFIALGGYIARLAKTHPFYKYKTNKLKNKYFSHLYPFMAEKYDETEAYWLTRAITDYVFDFDRRLYRDHLVEKFRGHVDVEKENLYKDMHSNAGLCLKFCQGEKFAYCNQVIQFLDNRR